MQTIGFLYIYRVEFAFNMFVVLNFWAGVQTYSLTSMTFEKPFRFKEIMRTL